MINELSPAVLSSTQRLNEHHRMLGNSELSAKTLPNIRDLNKRNSFLAVGSFQFGDISRKVNFHPNEIAIKSPSTTKAVKLHESRTITTFKSSNSIAPSSVNMRSKNNYKSSSSIKDFLSKADESLRNPIEQFSFNINDYRRTTDKKLGQSKLKVMLEERRKSCRKPLKKRFKPNSIANWKCFPILEQMIENSIIQFTKFDLLEGSATIQEKLIKELSKEEKDQDKITALLENMPGFKKFMVTMGIQRRTVNQAAIHLGLRLVPSGEFIFRQNDSSDYFYCIILGKVELSKIKTIEAPINTQEPQPHLSTFSFGTYLRKNASVKKDKQIIEFDDPFTTLNEGQVFGEYGLIDKDNNLRKASAKAIIETYLLTVDINCFKNYFKASVEKVFFDRKIFLLNHFPCFSDFSKEEFDKLYYKVVITPYRNSQTIINEGDVADKIFIILKGGTCKLTKNFKGETIHILNMQAGDIFGLDSVCNKNMEEVYNCLKDRSGSSTDFAISSEKMSKYTHSVMASSDDSNILKLELFKSTITVKKAFIQFLQSIYFSQNSSIEETFQKSIGLKAKFKLNYTKNELERKINPHMVSQYLDKNISEVETYRQSLINTKKINSVAIKYEISNNQEHLAIRPATFRPNHPNFHSELSVFALTDIRTESSNSKMRHTPSISVIPSLSSKFKEKEEKKIKSNCSNDNKKAPTSLKGQLNNPEVHEFDLANRVVKKRGNKFVIMISTDKPLVTKNVSRVSEPGEESHPSTRQISTYKTENFNLPLISKMINEINKK